MRLINRIILGSFIVLSVTWSSMAIADAPTKVKMAAILTVGPEEPWDGTFLKSWEKVRAEKPHGLEMNEPKFTEGVWGNAAEAAMRAYASQGYDIIWAHSTYSDQVKKIQKK